MPNTSTVGAPVLKRDCGIVSFNSNEAGRADVGHPVMNGPVLPTVDVANFILDQGETFFTLAPPSHRLGGPKNRADLMFENDFPLLSTPTLVALILHRAEAGPVTLQSCEAALAALFRQANETPGLPSETLRQRLAGHLSDLEIARILEPEEGGKWHLTDLGRSALGRFPDGLDHSDLAKYPEFAAHIRATAHHSSGMDPRVKGYDAGYQARRVGLPFTANPYSFDSVDHLSWENGWMESLEDKQQD